jgi:hypothetical protein
MAAPRSADYMILAIIGGFLGAGKTTLILSAARILRRRGLRPAAILNDQGEDLVDTHFVRATGLACDQVTGGCFCCRFPDLVDAAGRLAAFRPDVIFAEAVGSCTAIAATTLRPLLRDYGASFRIAPLTAVVDPRQAHADPDVDFLYQLQRAEADLIFTRGDDVAAWLDRLLAATSPVASKSIEVDYTRYAEAEAALAWLNARVTAEARPPVSPAMLIGPLLDRLEPQIRIVHLKLFTQCGTGYLKAALTGNGQEPLVQGTLDASPAVRHEIVLNIRALNTPVALRAIVEREVSALPGRLVWHQVQCFRPAPPVPYHASTGS